MGFIHRVHTASTKKTVDKSLKDAGVDNTLRRAADEAQRRVKRGR